VARRLGDVHEEEGGDGERGSDDVDGHNPVQGQDAHEERAKRGSDDGEEAI
jgi:hypothetical protein